MSTIIRCDRCGKDHAPSAVFSVSVQLHPDAKSEFPCGPTYVMTRDLCRQCYDALRIWLQGEDEG